MSRGLRAAFAVLFLAAALRAQVGPGDLFDASASNAFQPGQREYILALEHGRYAIHDGRVWDKSSALTKAQVAALFPAQTGGAGSDGPRAGDADAVRRAKALNRGSKPGDFDGAPARANLLAGPHPADPNPAPKAVDPAVLQTQLLNRLVFKGTPKEKAAMSQAVADILRTKTGRELAAQFVAEKASGEITFGAVEGSQIVIRDGRKVNSGSGGNTDVTLDPPRVMLNKDYLDSDPAYARIAMAGTLSHELFGHGFATQRARKAGLPDSINYFYRGDEIGAQLIGWLVETELAGKAVKSQPDAYLADPEKYHRDLWTNMPYYVLIMSPDEMKNPIPVLKARRANLDAALVKLDANRKYMKVWPKVIAHFTGVLHKMAPARFKPAEDELATYEHYAEEQVRNLGEIKLTLETRIKFWESPAGTPGAKQLAELKAGGNNAFLRGAEASLKARRAELIRLRAAAESGTAPAPVMSLPPMIIKRPDDPNAPIELSDVAEMQYQDRKKYPEHWNK